MMFGGHRLCMASLFWGRVLNVNGTRPFRIYPLPQAKLSEAERGSRRRMMSCFNNIILVVVEMSLLAHNHTS